MRIRSLLAVTLLVAPAAFGDEPAPAATATPAPDPMAAPWSIGAGLSTTVGVLISGLGPALSSTFAPITPLATITLERKLTTKTSLMTGLSMTASGTDSKPIGLNSIGPASFASQSVALALGVRHLFVGDPQLVALSGDVALNFGYARSELVEAATGGGASGEQRTISNAGQLSVIGGFSVEHLLIQRLALRINVRLIEAGYSAGHAITGLSGLPSRNSGFNLSIGVSPGLELRMYF